LDRTLADGDVIATEAGGLRVIATPGHAADHLAFALEGSGQLFSGDHVMAWSTSVVAPPDGSMADYVASLDRISARPETIYWPGHGGPVRNGQAFSAALKAHRMDREAMILGAIRAGSTTIPGIVAAVYPDLDPALTGAAASSAQAHLDWLEAKRVVTSEWDANGLRRYHPR
jgi:glyoxylase-like metal-dependent hydrolase (beta-lactamase superfamily II)